MKVIRALWWNQEHTHTKKKKQQQQQQKKIPGRKLA